MIFTLANSPEYSFALSDGTLLVDSNNNYYSVIANNTLFLNNGDYITTANDEYFITNTEV